MLPFGLWSDIIFGMTILFASCYPMLSKRDMKSEQTIYIYKIRRASVLYAENMTD